MKTKTDFRKIVWLTAFSISMGLLESAVVIYLRQAYYNDGFDFPLKAVTPAIALTELLREAATLIMLMAIGFFTGRTFSEKFAGFIYAFAIWDIFYYVFLWMLIGWPESLLTWDVLFLLPSMWTGPVIAPVITSLSMILLASAINYFNARLKNAAIAGREWLVLISGSIWLIWAFMYEFSCFLLSKFSFGDLISGIFTKEVLQLSLEFIPKDFPWLMFTGAQTVIVAGIVMYVVRNRRKNQAKSA